VREELLGRDRTTTIWWLSGRGQWSRLEPPDKSDTARRWDDPSGHQRSPRRFAWRVPDLPLPILAQQLIEQVRRIRQKKSAPSLLVLRSQPAGSLLYLILPTLDLYLAPIKSRNCSRCTPGVRYIYGDISMTSRDRKWYIGSRRFLSSARTTCSLGLT